MPKYLFIVCAIVGIIDAFQKMQNSHKNPADSKEYAGLLDFLLSTNK